MNILGINMSGAEFARSKTGQSKLITEYKNDVKKIKKTTENGKAYQELVKTVKKYWAGADADKFLKNVANYRNNIKQTATNAERVLEQAINADYNQFVKNQSTHY